MSNGTTTIDGQLEIDSARGVIYFHSAKTGITMLRICRLPAPIPLNRQLDITHLHGCDWQPPEEQREIAIVMPGRNPFANMVRTGNPADAQGDEFDEGTM